jgi:hypothetical protein
MKFNVTWQEEKTQLVYFLNVEEAERYAVGMMKRLGGFPAAKLLSIHPVLPDAPKDDKPPTPFGKPPSGTLGGGQATSLPGLPDAVAA